MGKKSKNKHKVRPQAAPAHVASAVEAVAGEAQFAHESLRMDLYKVAVLVPEIRGGARPRIRAASGRCRFRVCDNGARRRACGAFLGETMANASIDPTERGAAADTAKLLLRITLGVLILLHGISKIKGGPGFILDVVEQAGLPAPFGYLVYVGEVLAPILVIVGLWTRAAAMPPSAPVRAHCFR